MFMSLKSVFYPVSQSLLEKVNQDFSNYHYFTKHIFLQYTKLSTFTYADDGLNNNFY